MTQKNSKDSVQSAFLQIDLNYRFPLLVSLDPQMAGTKRQDSGNRIYPAIRGEFFLLKKTIYLNKAQGGSSVLVLLWL